MITSRHDATEMMLNVRRELGKGLVGQEQLVHGLLIGVLADGNVLVEGVPGLAKTRAVNLLANICRMTFKRIQFTPDLLPADIIGNRVYNHAQAAFETKKGPIFANFILADEINRSPAKVQSALLEAMQERQVTIGDQTFALPRPFFVFATQNPIEQEGTYPLPEAQLDRFLLKILVPYPSQEDENRIVKMIMNETAIPDLEALLEPDVILQLQRLVRKVFIQDRLIEYITTLVQASRHPEEFGLPHRTAIAWGASPRASIMLAQAARAHVLLDGRDAVTPDDIKAVAKDVLRHRVLITYHAEAEGIDSELIVDDILNNVKVP